MMGLGLFAMRTAAWVGFNPLFRGFGGEEGYLHEKVRQAGGKCWCLPALQWLHRFSRPEGVPYRLAVPDRILNYLIGHHLELDQQVIIDHFTNMGDIGRWEYRAVEKRHRSCQQRRRSSHRGRPRPAWA